MRMLFAILCLAAFLSGCNTPVLVKQAETLSDGEIRSLMKEGYFRMGRGLANTEGSGSWWKCPGHADAATVCELVNQDRRSIVNEILRSYPVAKTCYPLLACSPNKEAYDYWKAQGAPVGELHGVAGAQYKHPNHSLRFAAGIANPEIVALHLLDGADPRKRSGYEVSPLDEALHTWHRARNLPETGGYMLPIDLEAKSDNVILKPDRRNRRMDAASAAEVVQILIEAGASLGERLSDDAMIYSDLPGRRDLASRFPRNGTYLQDYYLSKIPELKEIDRRALVVRESLHACRGRRQRDACEQVLVKASAISPSRVWAQQQIAKIDEEQNNWNSLLAAQRCRVQRENWLYEGSSCSNGLAQGAGRARSRDKRLVIDGQFRQGQAVSGRLIVEGSPRYEGGFNNWTPEGPGICWHGGQPEECRMQVGERVDSLHKQRVGNERLRREREEREKKEAQARQEREWEAERRRRAQLEEERRERRASRNAQAFAEGIAAGIRSGNSVMGASNNSLASTQRTQQQAEIIAQGNAESQRAQVQREEARREEARRDAAQREAERQARQQAQQRLAAQQSQKTQTQAQAQQAARQQQEREAAAQKAREEEARRLREEEARRQQEAQAEAARKEAERQQREKDRLAKEQAEQQNKARLEADYLRAIKDGTRMKAVVCYGNHYVTGTRPRVKEPAHMSSCVDVSVTAWCPGDRSGRRVVATNFVGMGGCYGDTYKIEPKPACEAEQMRVVVEEVRRCR